MDLIVKEYLGSNIEFKMINGSVYANATSMASAFDNGSQKLADWKRSKKTIELINELNEMSDMENSHNDLIISEKGGIDGGGRTWIEENLVLDYAQYLSIKFRVWCNTQISTLIREGEVKIAKQDSYMINNPVDRAKRWIEEYEEKLALENKIQEDAPLVSLAEERLSFDDCVSITDATRTFDLKRGQLTKWAKNNGYIHKTITEVNQAGLEYFKIYDNGGYKNIGITKKGLKFIEMNLDEIKTK